VTEDEKNVAPSPAARAAGAVAGALLSALVASVPVALRLPTDVGLLRAWLVLAGVAFVPIAIAIPILRSALEGLRGLWREAAAIRAAVLAAWAAAFFVLLGVLGALLRAKTHHRALAGATFALAGLVLGCALGALAMRASSALRALAAQGRGCLAVAALALFGVAVLGLGVRVLGLPGALSPADRAGIVDVLALALGAVFGAGRRFERSRLTLGAIPAAALVFGAALLLAQPALGDATRDRAPVFGLLFRVVLRR
jgi:hypothetical protein